MGPAFPTSWLPRPRLERRLDGALTHALTVLVAAGGSGKSALLERWSATVPAVDHLLGAQDRSASVLAVSLVNTLRLRVPRLPPDLLPGIRAPRGPGGTEVGDALAFARYLGAALHEYLERDLVLVLDGLEVLDPSDAAVVLLDALVRHAPRRLRLVVASRRELPFPIERLRVQRGVLEFSGPDLALDADEVETWEREVLGAPTGLARQIVEATGGWAVAVHAALTSLAPVEPNRRREHLASWQPPEDLDAPLKASIGALTPEDRRTLAIAARLPLVTDDLLRHLECPDGARQRLATPGGLLGVDDREPGAARVSRAVGDLLRRQLDDPEDLEATVARAAAWFKSTGRPDLALETLTRGAPDQVPGLLRSHGDHLIERGPDAIVEAIGRLPLETAQQAWLQRLLGMANQAQGRWELAEQRLGALRGTGAFDAATAWRLGLILHLRGALGSAAEIYAEGAAIGTPPVDAVLCEAYAATVRWLQGDRDGCAELAERAQERAIALADDRALAATHTVLAMLAAIDGDRRANDAHYQRAVDHARQAGDVLQMIRIRSNRASHHLEEGAHLDALVELDLAERLAELTGFTPFAALAASNRAEALIHLGRLEEAAGAATDAVAAWRTLDSELITYALLQRAEVERRRGQRSQAIATLGEAVSHSERSGETQGLTDALARLAELMCDDDLDLAEATIDRARQLGANLLPARILAVAARVAVRRDDLRGARELITAATETAVQRRDQGTLAMLDELRAELDRDADAAQHARQRWLALDDPVGAARARLLVLELRRPADLASQVERLLAELAAIGCHELDSRGAALLRELTGTPALVVETFGGFRVARNGQVIDRTAWQSNKARQLLKLLVASRGQPVPRERLASMLWPEADTPTGLRRLSVLTSTLRSVLRTGAEQPEVVVSEPGTLRLDLEHLEVDLERFHAAVDAAIADEQADRTQRAREHWRTAVERYRGEFCADEPYAEWAEHPREQARAAFVQALSRLATSQMTAAEHDDAARTWLRLLEQDPFDERAHLALVSTLLEARRFGDARRAYDTYVRRMVDLGVEPAAFPPASPRDPSSPPRPLDA